MPWFGKYYYRSARVNGKPRKVYVGTGHVGMEAANADETARFKREQEKITFEMLQASYQTLDAALQQLNRLTDSLARSALQAAGYHQHFRGDWRKTRDSS